ncbi:MAG: glycosyltransferase [Coleofasciculaceae cyanobacterium SM2_1_6]|nr:glycosyltransferase [Coleofasciculaceae cyanobacterium SM2_1_6]
MPQISVIIPAYNSEKTIRETIDSVLAQTFRDLEIIVINDGSSDRTVEVVQRISDPRISFYSYPNGGPATSRNRGIIKSQGAYLSFIDADDLWTPDKLEIQYQALVNNPQAAVAYSGTDWIDEQGNFLRHASAQGPSGDVYAHALLYHLFGSGSNFLVRREALFAIQASDQDTNSFFDEFTKPSEDWDICIRLAKKYQFVAVPQVQILYRRSLNSLSSQLAQQERGTTRTLKKAFDLAPTDLQYLRRLSLTNIYRYITYKSLEGIPSHYRGWQGLRVLIKMLVYDISPIKQKVTWKILARVLMMLLFSRKLQLLILNKFKALLKVEHFLSYTNIHI